MKNNKFYYHVSPTSGFFTHNYTAISATDFANAVKKYGVNKYGISGDPDPDVYDYYLCDDRYRDGNGNHVK